MWKNSWLSNIFGRGAINLTIFFGAMYHFEIETAIFVGGLNGLAEVLVESIPPSGVLKRRF